MCSARMGSNPILVDIFVHTWVREAKNFISNRQKVNPTNAIYKIPKKGFRHQQLNLGRPGVGVGDKWFFSFQATTNDAEEQPKAHIYGPF